MASTPPFIDIAEVVRAHRRILRVTPRTPRFKSTAEYAEWRGEKEELEIWLRLRLHWEDSGRATAMQ
jgi:hypothetical protein